MENKNPILSILFNCTEFVCICSGMIMHSLDLIPDWNRSLCMNMVFLCSLVFVGKL